MPAPVPEVFMPLKSGMVIAPRSARAFTAHAVGIFWRVDNVLVIDRSTLAEAVLVTGDSHYQ
jgi:hypothetical protein